MQNESNLCVLTYFELNVETVSLNYFESVDTDFGITNLVQTNQNIYNVYVLLISILVNNKAYLRQFGISYIRDTVIESRVVSCVPTNCL